MRISFPNGEHTDVAFADGEVSIGSAVGNRVVLSVDGVAPRHAVLRIEPQRGILLDVVTPGANVFVNGREIQRFGFLRTGDVIGIGRVQIILKPDRDDAIVVQVPAAAAGGGDGLQRAAQSRVVLRGVAGGFFGRSISLQDRVVIGRADGAQIRIDDPDMPDQAGSFEIHGDRVVYRDLGSMDGAVVNGVAVRNAVLHPGDQIAIDVHRFVLEAPGLPARGSEPASVPLQPGAHVGSTQTLRAVKVDPPTPNPPSGGSAPITAQVGSATPGMRWGWLLLAAAVIAAGLTALFVFGPRFMP